jgi:hypothetical protein
MSQELQKLPDLSTASPEEWAIVGPYASLILRNFDNVLVQQALLHLLRQCSLHTASAEREECRNACRQRADCGDANACFPSIPIEVNP